MNLLVDIGNSRIKWALQDADSLDPGQPLPRQGKAFKDLARPAWKELDAPQRVIVSSVAGTDYDKSVRTWVKRRWKINPEFCYAQAQQYDVANAYREPARLGADRWAALLAVHAHYDAAAVIVDCGTAITVDAITAEGRHLGGLIAPGMELMSGAVTGKTACVETQDEEEADIPLLGASTEVAVAGGVLYAAVALVDRVFLDLKAELGRSTALILTGGDAERIQPLLGAQPILDTELVLKGLALHARKTAPQVPGPEEQAEDLQPQPEPEAAVCDT